VRAAATKALASMLQPLASFVLDSGLSVRELEVLFRTAAVHSVAQRHRASHQRVNISGIAATTGIPRAEISKILRTPKGDNAASLGAQSPINRILAAWHEEPGYQKPNGQAAELRVFGAAPSFEALVKKHGGGLPARAILDELLRVGAADVFGTQSIRAQAFAGISKQIDPEAIEAFAESAVHLLSALSLIERSPGYDFVSGISAANIESSQLPIFRREVAARAADFVSAMRENLTENKSARSAKGLVTPVVNLAIIYSEGILNGIAKPASEFRRNLRRMPKLRRL
jgi:hypothetical protein